jgi:diguanylate cyclase (GGDEF)-like protein
MRRFPFLAASLAVALIAVGVFGVRAAATSEAAQASELRADAMQIGGDFQAYFERAASLDLLLAQNPSFDAFYGQGRGDRAKLAEGGPVVAAMNRALAYLQVLYPGSIGEACVIDDKGREIARVVNGRSASFSELSVTESASPFFQPTLATDGGVVYQAAPYVSPDTHEWVISNSTSVTSATGERFLVHFEVTLESFRPYLQTALGKGYHAAVVDRHTGQIVLSSDTPVAGKRAYMPGSLTDWSREVATVRGGSGTLRIDGHTAAFRHLATPPGNANNWVAVEWTTVSPVVLPVWMAEVSIALGLLLLLFAGWAVRHQYRALRAAARLDGLTGLGNRQAVQEALEIAIRETNVNAGERCGVLMMDLNGFKQVNDVYGHHRGDALLQEIARRLHANVIEYDTPGRLGGDEFAVVLRRLADDEDALVVANRLTEALTRPIEIEGAAHYIGVSVGAAVFPDHGPTPEDLIRGADAAMYSAKRERGAPRLYQPGTPTGLDDLEQAAELLAALEHGQIVLHYQPEVAMETGQVLAYEALARWEHPERGLLPPSEFIPLAERVGLIRPLTDCTLRLALDQLQSWRARGEQVSVSVNLSALLLSDAQVADDIRAHLEARSIDPSALTIEVTETALLTDRATAANVLSTLRALGVRIEIDDFGAGYASFGYLRDLPLDGVKLDREFVASQLEANDENGLLRATIGTCRTLQLNVIAEGVEDAESYARLRDMGCDAAQGFHIARPAPPERMVRPETSMPTQSA